MDVRLSIGDFSRMTHLSVKALRYYHDLGLLEPAAVDPHSGYRYYEPAQLPTAQVIRRFRELNMPIDRVRTVLQAPDVVTRNALIAEHLTRMEAQLEQTQAAVSSLRTLLAPSRDEPSIPVRYQSIPAQQVAAISSTTDVADLAVWFDEGFDELYDVIAAAGIDIVGAGGGVYATTLFTDGSGDAMLFVPVDVPADAAVGFGRVTTTTLPGGEYAVATHHGRLWDADRAYAALGTHVAEHSLGVPGPVREYYVVASRDTSTNESLRTEICWPVFHTA